MHITMECYLFLVRVKVGACLIHVACILVKYPCGMLRTNKTRISQLGLLHYFLYVVYELQGDRFSPHMNSKSKIPKLNTANLTEETFTPKIDRNLKYLNMFGYQSFALHYSSHKAIYFITKITVSLLFSLRYHIFFKLVWKSA